jgi:hypothetical protein
MHNDDFCAALGVDAGLESASSGCAGWTVDWGVVHRSECPRTGLAIDYGQNRLTRRKLLSRAPSEVKASSQLTQVSSYDNIVFQR